MTDSDYVEVEVVGVGHGVDNKAVVLLKDQSDRQLPIWIGHCEALAIVQRLNKEFDPPRPLTQDLAVNLWKRLGGTLTQLRIDDLWEQVYYSKLTVEQDGQSVEIDCRPSDGIAMALTAEVPIFVANRVFVESSREEDEPEDE
jgi:bifunctional DNase/RNase